MIQAVFKVLQVLNVIRFDHVLRFPVVETILCLHKQINRFLLRDDRQAGELVRCKLILVSYSCFMVQLMLDIIFLLMVAQCSALLFFFNVIESNLLFNSLSCFVIKHAKTVEIE